MYYAFFIQVISLSMGKMAPGLAKWMIRTTNLSIIFWSFLQKHLLDNFIANRKFTSCYSINILGQIIVKNMNFANVQMSILFHLIGKVLISYFRRLLRDMDDLVVNVSDF